MAHVLHVDLHGRDREVAPFFYVAPEESIFDVIRRLGGTYRVEHVPDVDRPRTLSADAARFIADYRPEEPRSVLAIYWRYHSLGVEEFDTIEQAERYLDSGKEYGELAGEAIVHPDGTIAVCD